MYERTSARFEILRAVTIKFNVLRNVTLDLRKCINVSQERAAPVPWVICRKKFSWCFFKVLGREKFGKYVMLTGKLMFLKLDDTSQHTLYLHIR